MNVASTVAQLALIGGLTISFIIFFSLRHRPKFMGLWESLWAQHKVALIISAIGLACIGPTMDVGASLADVEFSPLTRTLSLLGAGITIFFSAIFGLGFSRGLDFEPLKLRQGIRDRKVGKALGQIILWMLVLIALNSIIQVLILPGLVNLGIAQPETPAHALEPIKESPLSKVFFCMLGGAGIQEEVIFRLLCMTGIWLATGRANLAMVISAVIFGAYHLSPLNPLYLEFWDYPLYQFSYTLLAGLVFAWVYRKGGIEATILGHTLWNFVGIILFVK